MDLAYLSVRNLILHAVPVPTGGEGSGPILSEAESPLDEDLRRFFNGRIRASLASDALDAEVDSTIRSPVPDLLEALLADGDLVECSQEMARHLYSVQNRAISGGLLVLARARLRNVRSVAVLKLEKEEGARVLEEVIRGQHALQVQHMRDLILSGRTRVYKVGLFFHEAGELLGLVSDNQRPRNAAVGVADFFMRRFLGFRFATAPDTATQHFFEVTERFINREVSDPEKKAQYQIALLAELNGQGRTISARRFAEAHLDVPDRQPYEEFARAEDLPRQQFAKDVSRIESRLRRVQFEFESGIFLNGPPAVVDERVRREERPDGQMHLEFEDKLRGVRGRPR